MIFDTLKITKISREGEEIEKNKQVLLQKHCEPIAVQFGGLSKIRSY
jgi:hypothetical protein